MTTEKRMVIDISLEEEILAAEHATRMDIIEWIQQADFSELSLEQLEEIYAIIFEN